MGWSDIRSALSENRPVTALVAAIGVIGAGIGAVSNGVSIVDIVQGKDKEKAAVAAAQQRETAALQAAAAAEQRAAAQGELNAWSAALESNNAAGYEFYLRVYPQGAHQAQAQTALASAQTAAHSAVPFAMDLLHPTVALSVTAARDAAKQAAARQADAEHAAAQAATAALQARNRVRGYGTVRNAEKDIYDGAVAGGKAEGLGVYVEGDAPHAGDRYQGQLSGGLWNGVGVLDIAAPGAQGLSRYAGEFSGGHLSGLGVTTRADGVRQAGAMTDGVLNGHGVETRADGSLFEGEFRNGAANGFGALWSPGGAIVEAGRYDNGQLVQPLKL